MCTSSRSFGGGASCLLWGSALLAVLASCGGSDPDRHQPRTSPRAPAATISVSGARHVGSQILLDGNDSSDPGDRRLTYRWNLSAKPAASTATQGLFAGARPGVVSLLPDETGMYLIRLTVSDGQYAATCAVAVLVQAPLTGNDDGQDDGNDGGEEDHVDFLCPTRGGVAGGDLVTFYGGVFTPGTRIRFGGRPAGDHHVLEDGALLTVLTPPADGPGPVDVEVQIGGRTFLLEGAFTYLPGALKLSGDPRDVPFRPPPTAMAALGGGRAVLGLDRGHVRVLSRSPGGGDAISDALRTKLREEVIRIAAGQAAEGPIACALERGGERACLLRFGRDGTLLAAERLSFKGLAIDAAVGDIDADGRAEVLVADRENRRLIVYAAPAEGAPFEPVLEAPVAGLPCALTTAQLDSDAPLEAVIGCFPGPDVTVVDFVKGAARTRDIDYRGVDGIVSLTAADFLGRGVDHVAALALFGGSSGPDEGPAAVRFLDPRASSGGLGLEILGAPRFDYRGEAGRLEPGDVDADGDVDLALFEGASGDFIVLENLRLGAPETPDECRKVVDGELDPAPAALDFRELRFDDFSRRGILAIGLQDLDGDGLPEALSSHRSELDGVRVLPNVTGR